ncbi:MAG TPA: hypothetical protein VGM23_17850, partial [Armatimonadota bacterium]
AYPTPSLAALPAPAPSPVPGISPHKLNQQDLKALSRTLRNEAERSYEREARTIRAEYERALQERLVLLAGASAQSRSQLDEQYRDTLLQLDLRDALAPHGTYRPSNQRAGATAPQSTPSPALSSGLLWRNLGAAPPGASATSPSTVPSGDTLFNKFSQLVNDPRRNYAIAVSKIDEELAEARKIAEQENKRALMERLQDRRQQMEAGLLKRIDEEVALLDIGAEGAAQPTPLSAMRFPEVPGGHLRVSAAGMAEQFTATNVRDAQGRREAVQVIDRSITELLAQRRQMLTDINADTRSAVVSLAMQHGYRVSIDMRNGPEITAAMRNWLAAYWPPANQ